MMSCPELEVVRMYDSEFEFVRMYEFEEDIGIPEFELDRI